MANSYRQNTTTEQIAKSINDLDNLLNSNPRITTYAQNNSYYIPINNVIQNSQIQNQNISQSFRNQTPLNLNKNQLYYQTQSNISNNNSNIENNTIPNYNSNDNSFSLKNPYNQINNIPSFETEEKTREIVKDEFDNLINVYKEDLKFNSNFLSKFEYDDGMNDVYKQINTLNNNIKNIENSIGSSLRDNNFNFVNLQDYEKQNKNFSDDLEKMYSIINNINNECQKSLDLINNKYQDENIFLRAKLSDLTQKMNDLEEKFNNKNKEFEKIYVRKEEFDNKINDINSKIKELNKTTINKLDYDNKIREINNLIRENTDNIIEKEEFETTIKDLEKKIDEYDKNKLDKNAFDNKIKEINLKNKAKKEKGDKNNESNKTEDGYPSIIEINLTENEERYYFTERYDNLSKKNTELIKKKISKEVSLKDNISDLMLLDLE